MKDALIFLIYKGGDGKNVTVSPRLGTGHSEPQPLNTVSVKLLEQSGITGGDDETGDYVVNAHCTGCRSWKTGAIDATSTKQPMIYAVGAAHSFFGSDDLNATIVQHQAFGQFTMDLKAAVGQGGVPTDTSQQTGVVHDSDNNNGTTLGSAFHAAIMAATFVLVFPTGAVALRLFERVWLHWMIQSLGVLLILVGAIVGIYISEKHDKVRDILRQSVITPLTRPAAP
ncbi:MAG: hypothetical protein Q9227_000027 [Pyrenula ochraceoflavens]